MEKINVLDKGHVILQDVMGNDGSIVDAARTSYGAGTRCVRKDEQLIRYLMKHRHTSPFEMCEVKFHIKAPLFVTQQWLRHRTASVNQVSARYSEIKDEFYLPAEWRAQAQNNKQGSEGLVTETPHDALSIDFESAANMAYMVYGNALNNGVARELARIALPGSTYTEFVWKIDLHNLFHFLKLRMDSHAQYEIRVYAEAMAKMVKAKFPISWRAFEDYVLHAKTFSRVEAEYLKKAVSFAKAHGFSFPDEFPDMSKRETGEFKKVLGCETDL